MENSIQTRLAQIKSTLPEGVELVAVSKIHPADAIQEAYNAGQRIFGENKVQEMTAKHSQLPPDIQWHFIGHVQKNKIRMMAPYVAMIQGVGSYDTLVEIDRQAAKCGRTIPCLLQLHVATEKTKFGFTIEECMTMLEEGTWKSLTHIELSGVMGMASNTSDEAQVASEFKRLKDFFDTCRERFFSDSPAFRTISAGMSGDYPIAIAQGSNLVRVGSSIFGERYYPAAR